MQARRNAEAMQAVFAPENVFAVAFRREVLHKAADRRLGRNPKFLGLAAFLDAPIALRDIGLVGVEILPQYDHGMPFGKLRPALVGDAALVRQGQHAALPGMLQFPVFQGLPRQGAEFGQKLPPGAAKIGQHKGFLLADSEAVPLLPVPYTAGQDRPLPTPCCGAYPQESGCCNRDGSGQWAQGPQARGLFPVQPPGALPPSARQAGSPFILILGDAP